MIRITATKTHRETKTSLLLNSLENDHKRRIQTLHILQKLITKLLQDNAKNSVNLSVLLSYTASAVNFKPGSYQACNDEFRQFTDWPELFLGNAPAHHGTGQWQQR